MEDSSIAEEYGLCPEFIEKLKKPDAASEVLRLQFPVAVNFTDPARPLAHKIYSVVLEYKTWKILASRLEIWISNFILCVLTNKVINRDLNIMEDSVLCTEYP